MSRWRFVLNRRWAGYLAVAVVFAIACVLLSHWQFARRDEALAEIAKVEDNWDRAPQPVDQVLADASGVRRHAEVDPGHHDRDLPGG